MTEIERDKRWENVTAHISTPQGYFYEDFNGQFNPLELTEFLIEVRYEKNVWYYRIIVENRELEEARLRTYQFTLDKMVEQIDYYMENTVMAFSEVREW